MDIYKIQLDSEVDAGLCSTSRMLLELMLDLDGRHLYTDNHYAGPPALYTRAGINYCKRAGDKEEENGGFYATFSSNMV